MTDPDEPTALIMGADKYCGNPYMSLLTDALRDQGVTVLTPEPPIFFPLTRTALRNPDADVVHLDWLYDYYMTSDIGYPPIDKAISIFRAVAFLLDLVLISLLSIAVVRTVHNKRHHGGKFRRTERLINEAVFLVADAVTVKCHAAAEIIASVYRVPTAEQLHVVPDGSYVSAYENDVSAARARADLSIPPDRFVYLFFGLIREYKGVSDLMRAFMKLDVPNAKLWIVGNPHDEKIRREVETLAGATDDVETVLEFVPAERIQYYMNASDVLVLPYRDILNSGSAHLGLSYGRPIVAPKIGCLPETLPSENRLLYDPNAEDGLREALRRAYDHPDLDSIGRANYEHAFDRNWASTATTLITVYRRAIAGA